MLPFVGLGGFLPISEICMFQTVTKFELRRAEASVTKLLTEAPGFF